MPKGDRTGPLGQGPGSGRNAGYCTGNDYPGYMNLPAGWGCGHRLGRGRGWNRGGGRGRGPGWGSYHPHNIPYPPMDEQDGLRREAENLESRLQNIKQRLEQLEQPAAPRNDQE